MTDTKICKKCSTNKPLVEFGLDRKRPDGLHPYCKACRNSALRASYAKDREGHAEDTRWRVIKYRYGITKAEWLALFKRQKGRCPICKNELTHLLGTRKDKARTTTDHCHDTGKVRGLLCGECNLGIGYLKHDRERLLAAVAYLDE